MGFFKQILFKHRLGAGWPRLRVIRRWAGPRPGQGARIPRLTGSCQRDHDRFEVAVVSQGSQPPLTCRDTVRGDALSHEAERPLRVPPPKGLPATT